MRSIAICILFASSTQAFATQSWDVAQDARDSVDDLIDKLLDREFRASSADSDGTDLDVTVIGKPGQLAMPAARQSAVSVLPGALPSAMLSVPPVAPRFRATHNLFAAPSSSAAAAVATAAHSRAMQGAAWQWGGAVGQREPLRNVGARASMTSLEGLSPGNEKMYTKDEPFKSALLSMSVIDQSPAGTTYNIVLSTENGEQQPFRYVEGQIIAVYVNHNEPAEKPNMLFLSIASSRYGDSNDGKTMSICYFIPKSKVEGNYFLSLKTGDPVMLTGAMGKAMLLPDDTSKDIVAFSVGTGVAPFRAFAKRLFIDDSPAKESFTGKMTLLTTSMEQATVDNEGRPSTTADLAYDADFKKFQAESGRRFAYEPYVTKSFDLPSLILQSITKDGDIIVDALKNGGHVYFAGPMKRLMDEVPQQLSLTDAGVNALIEAAKKEGRWHLEVY
eukprot:gnl/TRDRNA2_/TRDRNA2_85064_c0_seq1.p1 gnl/TRDRNA2_/TRDRNA2_85064_c0~~gnl/TRDRNA2_/TRDRNA2_85064_c0_seq1.p1  ORF type:complete len:446 (+),score=90.15 gnl/TRDRNA2_/TRDRNA2_85064_c0_seq1:145-1482(+)